MCKPRLQRLKVLFTDHPLYFVTACSHNRRTLLDTPEVQEAFLRFCEQASERGVFVGRFVLMPDHLHLFAAFAPQTFRLSDWVKSLKNALSAELRRKGFRGEHWQKGFFDHVMRSQESYAQKWEYVRNNPVRAGLVEQAAEWPYQGAVFHLTFDDGLL